MLPRLTIAIIVMLFVCDPLHAEVTFTICCTPGSFVDVGDIASDGSGGRQPVVRALGMNEASGYTFFYVPLGEDGYYVDPPATPSQEELVLQTGQPLVLTIPQLSHFPQGAEVAVEHSFDGTAISVDAQIHYLGWSTDWYAPPHEYVHDLGSFAPGDYELTLNLSHSIWSNPNDPSVTRGHINFTVVSVPEPAACLTMVFAVTLGNSIGWRRET